MIEEFRQYIKEAICRPDERFKGWPICPYACNARIRYVVTDSISPSNILAISREWDEDIHEVLIILFIGDVDCRTLNLLRDMLSFDRQDCEIFAGHPQSDFTYRGVYTRRDPYSNLQFNKRIVLDEFRDKLKRTNYYESLA